MQYRRTADPGSPWVTFASGSATGSNIFLGTFDPTLLVNGLYDLRLTAVDLAGQEVFAPLVTVTITDNMKLGQFTLSFTDLQIPVSGLPITLTRSYDSRDQDRGEFGTGWKLDVSSIRLKSSAS